MSEQIDDIIHDLFDGNAIAEDEQELIKSALKLRELVKECISLPPNPDGDKYNVRKEVQGLFQFLVEKSEK